MLREELEDMRDGRRGGLEIVRLDYIRRPRGEGLEEETEKYIFELPRIHEVEDTRWDARLRTIQGDYYGSSWSILLPRTVRAEIIPRELLLPDSGTWIVPEMDVNSPKVRARLRKRWMLLKELDRRLKGSRQRKHSKLQGKAKVD